MQSERTIGYVLALTQTIMYSTMGVACKFLYNTGLTTGQVVLLRYGGTVLILGLFLLMWRKHRLFSRQPAVYAQSVFFVASTVLSYLAVRDIGANIATVLFYAYPPVIAIAAAVVFKERPSARTVAALAVSMLGVFLLSGVIGALSGGGDFSARGVAFGIAACLCFAVYGILGQAVVGKKDSPFTMTFTMSVVGVIICAALYGQEIPTLVSVNATQLGVALFMVLFNTILPVVMLLEAIKRIGATITSIISIAETPFAVVLAFLVLGETMTAMQLAGTALIVGAIALVTLPEKKKADAQLAEGS